MLFDNCKKTIAAINKNNEKVIGGGVYNSQWFDWLYNFNSNYVDLYKLRCDTEYGIQTMADVTNNFNDSYSNTLSIDVINNKMLFDNFTVDINTACGTYNKSIDNEIYKIDTINIYTINKHNKFVIYEFDSLNYSRIIINNLSDILFDI